MPPILGPNTDALLRRDCVSRTRENMKNDLPDGASPVACGGGKGEKCKTPSVFTENPLIDVDYDDSAWEENAPFKAVRFSSQLHVLI